VTILLVAVLFVEVIFPPAILLGIATYTPTRLVTLGAIWIFHPFKMNAQLEEISDEG
jgi:hypothetical protein